MIDALVDQAADATGLTTDQSRTALAAALALIEKHADPERVTDLFSAVEGAKALAEEGAKMTQNKSGGLMAGMMRTAGGAGGAAMSDALALGPFLLKKTGKA